MLRISYRRKLFLKKILRIALFALLALLLITFIVLIYLEPYVTYDRDGAHLNLSGSEHVVSTENTPQSRPVVNDAQISYGDAVAEGDNLGDMTGYYVTTTMLRQPDKVLSAVKELEEPCAIMLQLKSIFGNFYYSTSIEGTSTADADIAQVDALISYLKSNGFYMIAEVPAFCDPVFALENQKCGLPIAGGALWRDENACYWLDPADEMVLSYLLQIARELSSLGFQEVVFSEFRFPSSNNIVYNSDRTSAELIELAAEEITAFFTGSNLTISFTTDDTQFPASACSGHLYIPDVDGSKVEKYVQAFSDDESLKGLIFLANSKDTRFEEQTVLRPLLTQ